MVKFSVREGALAAPPHRHRVPCAWRGGGLGGSIARGPAARRAVVDRDSPPRSRETDERALNEIRRSKRTPIANRCISVRRMSAHRAERIGGSTIYRPTAHITVTGAQPHSPSPRRTQTHTQARCSYPRVGVERPPAAAPRPGRCSLPHAMDNMARRQVTSSTESRSTIAHVSARTGHSRRTASMVSPHATYVLNNEHVMSHP